jgi:hypothetical protein
MTMKRVGPQPAYTGNENHTVERGFVILDGRGEVWGGMIFAEEEGANMTAARCVPSASDIRAARKVTYVDRTDRAPKVGTLRVQFLLD